ncbi:hypothetical protein GGH99_002413, partial [Coemansia sp. RSA 1285]
MITEAHKTPLALSIATGIDESDRIKLAAKQKVAWQHAQPRYVKYSDFLTHALNRRQWDRINLVLKRMVVDSVRWGIPTRVAPRLLDRCIDDLFSLLVADSRQNRLSVPVATTDRNALLAAASHLAEIAWRTDQDTSNLYPKWELVALFAAAFAEDGAGGQNTAYVHALRNLEIAICAGNCATVRQTLVDVLNSSYLTPRLLSDIFAACQIAGDVRTDVLLTTDLVAAFYLALQRPDQLGSANLHEMAEKVNHGLLEGHSFITRTLSGNANSRSSANTARAAVALIHLLLTRPHREKQISGILAHLDRLSAMARWPMGALAHSVRLLVDVGELKEAQDLVLSVGNGNIKAFMQTLQNTGMLGVNHPVLRLLVEEVLAIQLHIHKTRISELSTSRQRHGKLALKSTLPMAPFSISKGLLHLESGDSFNEVFRQYYTSIRNALESAGPRISVVKIIADLISEASNWMLRLNSTGPLLWLTEALAPQFNNLSTNDTSQILLEFTRALCSFKMPDITQLDSALGKEPHFGCASAMRGFTGTRNVILREYLRHGIEPPPEALAVFAHHMRISGEHERAQDFAAAIMPQMFPQLTGEQSAGKQAVRAYYEWMLYSCRNRGRKLLQLFSHLMGHHGVDSIGFKIKLVELTI